MRARATVPVGRAGPVNPVAQPMPPVPAVGISRVAQTKSTPDFHDELVNIAIGNSSILLTKYRRKSLHEKAEKGSRECICLLR